MNYEATVVPAGKVPFGSLEPLKTELDKMIVLVRKQWN